MKYELTQDERKLLAEANAARQRDDWETVDKLIRLIPLDPVCAKATKTQFGAEFMIKKGYNLKWANMEFGDDWLEK